MQSLRAIAYAKCDGHLSERRGLSPLFFPRVILLWDRGDEPGGSLTLAWCNMPDASDRSLVVQPARKKPPADAVSIKLKVNGKQQSVDVSPDTPLLWVLRETLGLTGTKFGCGMALCGACTVHLNGEAVRSCVTPISRAAGKDVTTIEGLDDEVGHLLQAAWIEEDVVQCGYCQSGQIMSAAVLLRENPQPTDEDIDDSMTGNICRCGTYQRIRQAIHRAAQMKAGEKPAGGAR